MEQYTASNGVIIHEQDGHVSLRSKEGGVLVVGSGNFGTALKEYVNQVREEAVSQRADEVQAKRDFELGRWRWPENPDYVVYPQGPHDVKVLRESTGASRQFTSDDLGVPSAMRDVARAYFDAHPEPKPAWHDAKPWDTWLLTIDGIEHARTLDEDRELRDPGYSGSSWMHITSDRITAARRIWPAEDAS